jgi:hypothetical protein
MSDINVRPLKEEEGEFGMILFFGCVYGTTEVMPSQSKKRQAISGKGACWIAAGHAS